MGKCWLILKDHPSFKAREPSPRVTIPLTPLLARVAIYHINGLLLFIRK